MGRIDTGPRWDISIYKHHNGLAESNPTKGSKKKKWKEKEKVNFFTLFEAHMGFDTLIWETVGIIIFLIWNWTEIFTHPFLISSLLSCLVCYSMFLQQLQIMLTNQA